MANNNYTDYQPTQAANTVAVPFGMPAGSLPSQLYPIIRQLMAALRNTGDLVLGTGGLTAAAGGPTAYSATLNYVTAPTAGMSVELQFPSANSASPTLTINGGSAFPIVTGAGGALQAGYIATNQIALLYFTGTQWQLVNAATGLSVNVQVFKSSGTYTPTSGIIGADVRITGGGGGANGGGGGGALTNIAIYTSTQLGASQTVTIGAAGTAGNGGNTAGGTGGTTSFGSLMTAGGGGGAAAITAYGNTYLSAGGTGATAYTGGNYQIIGQGGGAYLYVNISGTVSGMTGAGGSSAYGGGGSGLSYSNSPLAGVAGGSGAGGGGAAGGSTPGASGSGICVVTEYILV